MKLNRMIEESGYFCGINFNHLSNGLYFYKGYGNAKYLCLWNNINFNLTKLVFRYDELDRISIL